MPARNDLHEIEPTVGGQAAGFHHAVVAELLATLVDQEDDRRPDTVVGSQMAVDGSPPKRWGTADYRRLFPGSPLRPDPRGSKPGYGETARDATRLPSRAESASAVMIS